MCCELQERVDEKATQASSRLWIVAVNSLHTSRTKKKRERVKKIRVSVTLGCSLRDEPIFSSLTRIFSRFSVPEKIFFPFRRKNLVYNIIRFSFAVFSCRTNENEINFIYFRTISRVKGFIRFFLSHKSFKHFVCYFFIQKRSASHAGSSNFLIKTFWMHGFERQDLRIPLYIFTSIFLFSEFYSYQTSPSECPGLSFAAFCSSIYAIRNLVMLDKGMEKKSHIDRIRWYISSIKNVTFQSRTWDFLAWSNLASHRANIEMHVLWKFAVVTICRRFQEVVFLSQFNGIYRDYLSSSHLDTELWWPCVSPHAVYGSSGPLLRD